MEKKKARRKLFQADLRKEEGLPVDMDRAGDRADHQRSSLPVYGDEKAVEDFLPPGYSWDQPRVTRVDSHRAPPLKLTLDTIEEDAPKPNVVNYLRSKSLPAHRRFSLDNNGPDMDRFRSFKPGQGDYLSGACGVSMSGPILPSSYDYDSAPRQHRSRFSLRFSRIRDALRNGRVRQALHGMLSRMRPTSRRSS